jgi:hypothetical protein
MMQNSGKSSDIFSIFEKKKNFTSSDSKSRRQNVNTCPLANVVEDVRKQDNIVIVGGAGNSLDINQGYSIDKDLIFIAERTSNINVGFVSIRG